MMSVSKHTLCFFLYDLFAFYFFSFVVLARTSNMTLNKSHDSGPPSRVPVVGGSFKYIRVTAGFVGFNRCPFSH